MADPWEQMPDETRQAYKAFCYYRDLGRDRTLDEAYRREQADRHKDIRKGIAGKRASGQWRTWQSAHKWVKRSEAWDQRNDRAVQEGVEAKLRTLGESIALEDWESGRATRRAQQEQDEWALRDKLVSVGTKMLEHALFTKRRELVGAGSIEVHQPAAWNFDTAGRLLKLAMMLGRTSSRMPLQISEDTLVPDTGQSEAMWEAQAQVADRLPAGAMPDMPDDPNARPPVSAAAAHNSDNPHNLQLPEVIPRPQGGISRPPSVTGGGR